MLVTQAHSAKKRSTVFLPTKPELLKETMTMNEQTRKWQAYGGANANTDWFKEFYNDWVPSQEHSLSISGGSRKRSIPSAEASSIRTVCFAMVAIISNAIR